MTKRVTVKPSVVAPASDLGAMSDRRCTCCKRELRGKFAWLELDQRTGTYHDFGGIPTDRSQGWFPFGLSCAKRQLAMASAAIPFNQLETKADEQAQIYKG